MFRSDVGGPRKGRAIVTVSSFSRVASRLEMHFCVCDRTDVMDIDNETIEAIAEENEESRNRRSYLTQKLRDIGKNVESAGEHLWRMRNEGTLTVLTHMTRRDHGDRSFGRGKYPTVVFTARLSARLVAEPHVTHTTPVDIRGCPRPSLQPSRGHL